MKKDSLCDSPRLGNFEPSLPRPGSRKVTADYSNLHGLASVSNANGFGIFSQGKAGE